MDLRLEDPEEIIKRVTPLLNEILLKNLEEKEGRTVEILSEYLASVIKRASQTHLPELSEALQKVIAPAISKEIANNQEVMIDALYPIMGGMISKYVTQSIKELMEQINKKIEQGLSFERIKRKMKAKLSGVSETELLLEESSDALISSMFIIHKETGILISSASLENREIDEPHLVASMASAIKDFINDWISRSGSETIEEVQILSYANATLYIESAGSVYVIAFLDSEPDYELRSEINTFFASLVKEHGSFFRAFEGDDSSPETKEIAEEMRAYLLAQKNIHREEKGKSNFAKYILTAVALAVGGYVLYGLYVWYGEYVVEKRIARETGTLVSISRSEDKVLLEGYVDDLAKTKRIETIVKETLKPKEIVDHLHLDVRSLQNLMGKISQEKAEMRRKLDEADRKTEQSARQSEALLAKVDSLEKRLTQQEKRIAAFGKITHMEQEVAQKLAEALKGSPYYHERTQELDFAKLDLYPVMQASMKKVCGSRQAYLRSISPYSPLTGRISKASL
ncbi:MAG: hypothetical protein L3J47_06090 [Sulfurovum sp.]|nr:hypothetical protein [Sulfurovum sp.]